MKIQMQLHKIFGPIVRWKIELRPLRDPSIKCQKMRWHALMSGDDINYSTKPTKPNLTSSKYERVPKEYASVELLQMTFERTRYLWGFLKLFTKLQLNLLRLSDRETKFS